MKKISRGTLDLIGDTPILKLQKVVPANAAEVWLKFEAGNPTGSYKDPHGQVGSGKCPEAG